MFEAVFRSLVVAWLYVGGYWVWALDVVFVLVKGPRSRLTY